jgi:hypothetical protein
MATSGYVPNVRHPEMMRSVPQGIIDTATRSALRMGARRFGSRAEIAVSSRQGAVASQDHSRRRQQLEA